MGWPYLAKNASQEDTKHCQDIIDLRYESFGVSFEKDPLFSIKVDSEVVGTVNLINAKEQKLSLAKEYSGIVTLLENCGLNIIEVSGLAVMRKGILTRETLPGLFTDLCDHARKMGGDVLLIGVHPKYRGLYRWLGFAQLGVEKKYKHFNNVPVIMLGFSLARLDSNQ